MGPFARHGTPLVAGASQCTAVPLTFRRCVSLHFRPPFLDLLLPFLGIALLFIALPLPFRDPSLPLRDLSLPFLGTDFPGSFHCLSIAF